MKFALLILIIPHSNAKEEMVRVFSLITKNKTATYGVRWYSFKHHTTQAGKSRVTPQVRAGQDGSSLMLSLARLALLLALRSI